MRMTLLYTGQQSKKPVPSGKDKLKERMEADAGRLFDHPSIVGSSTLNGGEGKRSSDPLAAVPPLSQQQQQVKTISDGPMERSKLLDPSVGSGCNILDHNIEMGNYNEYGHITASATNEKRDDDEGISDTNHIHEYEEEQIMMGNCCVGSEPDSFGRVFKFLQFHEM